MGYASGHKGVLCYNLVTSKFLISRHVVHDESIFAFTKKILSSSVNTIKSSSTTPIIISLPDLEPLPQVSSSVQSSPPRLLSEDSFPTDSEFGTNVSHARITTEVHVLNDHQLQVLLPPIVCFSATLSTSQFIATPINSHGMTTKAKNGIVQRKDFSDYQCFYTSLPSLCEDYELTTFKVASQSSAWMQAMCEEIAALDMQGT